jgi:type I restriction enzyme S subunit
MSEWDRALIGEVVRVIGGGTPTRTNPDYYGGDIPWVTPKDMKSWHIDKAQVNITQEGLECSTARLAPANSVLIVVRSGVLKHTLPVGLNRRPVAINQDMKALICSDRIDPNYLARFIKERSGQILQWVRATTADNFPIDNLKKLPIPLPPLDEQRRIAAVLDKVDALRAKRREAIALLDDLTQSVFLDMFGDPVSNDRNWPPVSVGEFVSHFESGKNFAAAESEDPESQFRILKVSSVTSGNFLPKESKPVPAGYNPPESHIVRNGDLLFSRANTELLIGATALVENAPKNLLLPDKLWRFVWHSERKANPLYVRQLFRQSKFRREVSRRASGTSGSMKNISQQKVLSIPCGLPPLELQDQFAERVSAITSLKEAHRTHLAHLDELFASLQQRAFRGDLFSSEAA